LNLEIGDKIAAAVIPPEESKVDEPTLFQLGELS
jgi:hypothetical protein